MTDAELDAIRGTTGVRPVPAPLVDLGAQLDAAREAAKQAALNAPQAPVEASVIVPPVSNAYRFFRGVKDPVDAGAQLMVHSLPNSAVDWVNQKTQEVNDTPVIGPITKALGMVPATAPQMDTDIANAEKEYQAGRQAAGNTGMDWWRTGGNLAGTLPAALSLPAATSIKGAVGLGALLSPLASPVTEVTPQDPSNLRSALNDAGVGDYWVDKGKQAAGGAITSGALSGLARLLSPALSDAAQKLSDEGIRLTPGQMLGGGYQRVEDAVSHGVPFLGDMIRNAQRRGITDLNTAAINRSLAPIGEELPAGAKYGHEAIDYAGGRLSAAYNDVLDHIGAVKVDPAFKANLQNLNGLVQGLPQDTVNTFNSILKREVFGKIDKNGVMTSDAMKGAESNLRSIASKYNRSNDYNDGQLADAVLQAREELRNLVARNSPDWASKLQDINKGWANFVRVQRAAGTLGADDGVFTAAQLNSAVKAMDESTRKGGFSSGNALMQDLSNAAKTVQSSKVPNSGTPFQHAAIGGLGAAAGYSHLPPMAQAAVLPVVGGIAAAGLPYTSAAQTLLSASRPEWLRSMANRLLEIAPATGAVLPALSR